MILYDNEEIYGESIEFYDIASSLPSGTYVYLLEKFAKACSKKAGIVLDIGAGTGRNAIELAKRMPDKEIVALEPSKYMRIAFMAKLAEYPDMQNQVTVLPLSAEAYEFQEKASGVLCMGVLGHLREEERKGLWRKLAGNLDPGVPVLIEILDERFLGIKRGTRISVSYQGHLRYETYVEDMEKTDGNVWRWLLSYRVFRGEKMIRTVECPMCWTYNSVEDILKELADTGFGGCKLADNVLIVRKSN